MYPQASEANSAGKLNQNRSYSDGTAAAPPTRRTLSTALDQQAQELVSLHIHLDELEARLRPLLDSSPQPPGGVTEKTIDPRGPLDIVERHNGGINAAVHRLRDFTNRFHL